MTIRLRDLFTATNLIYRLKSETNKYFSKTLYCKIWRIVFSIANPSVMLVFFIFEAEQLTSLSKKELAFKLQYFDELLSKLLRTLLKWLFDCFIYCNYFLKFRCRAMELSSKRFYFFYFSKRDLSRAIYLLKFALESKYFLAMVMLLLIVASSKS